MNNPIKISHLVLATVILFTGCQQEESVIKNKSEIRSELSEMDARLNVKELEPPMLVEADKEGSRTLTNKTIGFDDNGVCINQNALGLPGCTTGVFMDPTYSYYYTLKNYIYFYVFQSEGPENGLAEAGSQLYLISDLDDDDVNHELVSQSCYWTKYIIYGNFVSGKVYFDLKSIRIKSSTVSLYFYDDNGWHKYSSLAPGNYALDRKNITEFHIRSKTCNLLTQYKVDDIVIENVRVADN